MSETGPSIVLNGITFTLLNKFMKGTYEMVLYSADDGKEVQKYTAYKSHSEGLWRFAYTSLYFDELFIKGDDYITTTQIHMDLQCLFETHYKTLPPIDFKDVRRYVTQNRIEEDPKRSSRVNEAMEPHVITYIRDFAPPGFGGTVVLPDETTRVSRDFVHPVFLPLVTLMRPGEGIKRLVYAMTHPVEVESNFYKIKTQGNFHNSEIANYKTSGKNIRKMPRDFHFQKMQEIIQEISERDGLITGRINESPLVNVTFNPEPKILTAMVSVFSEYMEFFFKTGAEPSTRICEITMPIPGSPTTIPLVIYKRQLQLIKDRTPFDLYYAVYTIPDEFPEIKGTYKTVVNLVPSPSLANEFGMNKYYISTGIYVYKIFDYGHQFPREGKPLFGEEPKVVRGKKQPDTRYVFLGDLLTNMWPLQKVTEGVIGGKRKRHQRTKRTHKKRRHTRKRHF